VLRGRIMRYCADVCLGLEAGARKVRFGLAHGYRNPAPWPQIYSTVAARRYAGGSLSLMSS